MADIQFQRDRTTPSARRGATSNVGEEGLKSISIEASAPSAVVKGDTYTVSGEVVSDRAFSLLNSDFAVDIEGPGVPGGKQVQEIGKMSNNERRRFEFQVNAVEPEGGVQEVRLVVNYNNFATFGWDRAAAKNVRANIVGSETEKAAQNASGFLPWVAGGAAIGAAAKDVFGLETTARGAALGGGSGALAKLYLGDVSVPSIPTDELIILGVLGGGAFLGINYLTGGAATSVTRTAGSAVASVADSTRSQLR